jgi:hypothetical protein
MPLAVFPTVSVTPPRTPPGGLIRSLCTICVGGRGCASLIQGPDDNSRVVNGRTALFLLFLRHVVAIQVVLIL